LILPCFNEAERLPDTLAPLLAELPQGLGEVEVLVVDDGSTDETLAVACAIATRDARVRVIHSRPNRGKGLACARAFWQPGVNWWSLRQQLVLSHSAMDNE
jgi:glycosyltransferase involved in cell wall biosynthesis